MDLLLQRPVGNDGAAHLVHVFFLLAATRGRLLHSWDLRHLCPQHSPNAGAALSRCLQGRFIAFWLVPGARLTRLRATRRGSAPLAAASWLRWGVSWEGV